MVIEQTLYLNKAASELSAEHSKRQDHPHAQINTYIHLATGSQKSENDKDTDTMTLQSSKKYK